MYGFNPFPPPGISTPRPLAVAAVQRPPRAPPWVPEVVPRLPWAALMSSTIASAEYRTFSDALALREPLRAVLPCSPVWYMSTENHAVSLSADVAELAL